MASAAKWVGAAISCVKAACSTQESGNRSSSHTQTATIRLAARRLRPIAASARGMFGGVTYSRMVPGPSGQSGPPTSGRLAGCMRAAVRSIALAPGPWSRREESASRAVWPKPDGDRNTPATIQGGPALAGAEGSGRGATAALSHA